MNKLYWIVCEDSERTLYEGRYLGRTRGAALKHLKDTLGRSNLTGLVFAITEIPVPLIREIVAEVLAGNAAEVPLSETRPEPPAEAEAEADAGKVVRYAPFDKASENTPEEAEEAESDPPPSGATTRLRTDYDWAAIKASYMEGRGPKDVAALMDVPINTLRKRITREGWAKERREA